MRTANVGDIPMVEADEDLDLDVEIVEQEERRLPVRKGKSARQLIEDMKDGVIE